MPTNNPNGGDATNNDVQIEDIVENDNVGDNARNDKCVSDENVNFTNSTNSNDNVEILDIFDPRNWDSLQPHIIENLENKRSQKSFFHRERKA